MFKVGGEIDTYCTRCELTLAHTVIALMAGRPVKVECNTCHSVRRYRGAAAASSGGAGRVTREKRTVISFDEVLGTKDRAGASPYSPRTLYRVDQVIDHPIFGTGFVSAVRDGGKIEVTFRTDVKLLVHGKT